MSFNLSVSSLNLNKVHFGFKTSIEASAKEFISFHQVRLSRLEPRSVLESIKEPASICDVAANKICEWVKEQSQKYQIPEKTVYKLFLREVKKYELRQLPYRSTEYLELDTGEYLELATGQPQKSTFALRNSLLSASQKSHVVISSAEIFTKSVIMPANKWDYLDAMNSWIPEEQRVMGKWVETSMVKCLELGQKRVKNEVILLKGGFGAGKTRLTKEMFQDYGQNLESCVVAPDKGKKVVLSYFPTITHQVAQDQGSALSYKFFNHMMTRSGTIVYDSALSDPRDLQKYIEKAELAVPTPKNVVVYDIARLDVMRALVVLKRPMFGEDPRIPPEFVIYGAVASKLSRIECMSKVLNSRQGAEHEYHFQAGDDRGANMRELIVIKNNKAYIPADIPDDVVDRCLALENLKIEGGRLFLTAGGEELTEEIRQQFNGFVSEYVERISPEARGEYEDIFAQRTIPFQHLPENFVFTIDNIYESLSPQFTRHMSKKDFMASLQKTPEVTQQQFLNNCHARFTQGRPISYLDFPLYTALAIHANLHEDPWAAAT